MASNFYKYFKENMEAMGLSAPASLFDSAGKALATVKTYMDFVKKFGTKVTVREAIGAGVMEEQMAVAGAVYASYYTGAVIGSICVAIQRCAMGGTTIADILWWLIRKASTRRICTPHWCAIPASCPRSGAARPIFPAHDEGPGLVAVSRARLCRCRASDVE